MYCRKCGKQLNDDWKSCPYCGEPRDGGQDIEKTVSESRNISTPFYKKWLFWVLVVAIVLVIGLMSILVLKIGGKDNNEPKAQVAEEKYDFSEQDFKDLIGKKAEDVENAGLILSDTPDEYVALDGKLKIIMKNDRVDQIIIGGQSDTAPAFYSVQIGMNGEEAKSKLTEFYPEDTSTEEMLKLSNLEKKESVECNLSEGKVSDIRFLTLTDEAVAEINNEKQEKMQAEYIFPDSDKKYLSEDEIRSIDTEKMALGRNEIFARHGYIFTDETYKEYFESKPWYKGSIPADQFNADQEFNDFEKKNVELIKQIEDEINGGLQTETEDAEAQKAADDARDFVVGRQFHLQDSQRIVEFTDGGEFIVIGYYGSDPVQNKYCTYSFSSRYEYNKDAYQYMVFLTIDGVEYYFRYFTNGTISLEGDGEFYGWYELYQ